MEDLPTKELEDKGTDSLGFKLGECLKDSGTGGYESRWFCV